VSWSEEYQRKRGERLVRKAQRLLARLDTPTPVEVAKAKLASTALHLALANRALTVKELAGRLDALINMEPELKQAAATLQKELLIVELRRIAREAIPKAPDVRPFTKQLKEVRGHRPTF
jgi:hypothetical protein